MTTAAHDDPAGGHVDVLIVGAGLSGIGAAYRLQEQCPGTSYAVLEARAAIGGTWDLFRYPGVRSDSDVFTLSYPFRPWRGPTSLADGESIESVLIPEATRLTLCISTQAGCAFGCVFCATAVLGLKRNLTCSEIVDQILEVSRTLIDERRITHVVLMGMGEPLANYDQTLRALQMITDSECGIAISPRRVTLSTVGLVPQIERLMSETKVNLAISLHAPNDELRGQLMPVNRKYSLAQLIDCCRSLPIPRRKRITFEYVLLHGVNDSDQHARELAKLLRGIPSKVNVIPFNPHPGSEFLRPSNESIACFQDLLHDLGVQINVRRPRGDDIQAACGQLQGEEAGRERGAKRRAEVAVL